MECIAPVGATLGEGPVWVDAEQALYWLDIPERILFRWSETEELRTIALEAELCSLAPRSGGGYIGAGYDGFVAVDDDFRLRPLGDPEPTLPTNRFNDGKIDREGRFWAGTMDRFEREASGSLYRLDSDLSWTQIDRGYRVTNGPAFSRDGRTLYHTDSTRQRIYAFDLTHDGSAGNRRVFASFGPDEGYPDGMTVDEEDCLWVAFWDGWCVRRLSPAGERLAELRLPVQRPTSCAFGGPALDRLFVTSASRDLDKAALAAQPEAGGLFVTLPGVRGIPEPVFAG